MEEINNLVLSENVNVNMEEQKDSKQTTPATEKVAVYIDGGNTYRALRELNAFDKFSLFSYDKLVESLLEGRSLVSKRYYIGTTKNFDETEKGEKMVKDQQKFLEGLRADGFEIKLGKIREKGVDVKIAIDLVVGAADDLFDTAIVLSSDTDLIPAIKYIKKGKLKKVEYISFGSRVSLGMVKECSRTKIFSEKEIEMFKIPSEKNIT